MQPDNITYFAETDARGKRVRFGIKDEDRLRHVYSIGKTGMGKSTMLENMAIQDIQNGNGMAFLDPHGKTADLLLEYIPEHRVKDVIYFAPFDTEYPISFNVMEDVGVNRRHLVVSGLMSAFEKLFGEESFSDRMQYILQNTILALLEYPGATMLGINRMFTDKVYRNKVIANVTDTSVKAYWTQEFASYTERFAAEATPAIQNKIGQFTSNPLIRNIIGQPKSSFDIRKIMDEKKILIVNLSKGLVGENNANLLGSMLVTKIYLAAMSRADANPVELKKLPNFYLYVDEFQSFANKSFADILSEARKYKLSLNITHQYVEQMAEEVRAAVFGNVGTLISFRVGSFDAEILEKEFAPVFTAEDIVNLGFVQIYLKLMIDGVASQPFSATTLPPISKPQISWKEDVMNNSRKTYANQKSEVEKAIKDWHEPEASPSKPRSSSQFESKPQREFIPDNSRPKYESRNEPRKDNFAVSNSNKVEPDQNAKPNIQSEAKTLNKAIEEALKNKNIEKKEEMKDVKPQGATSGSVGSSAINYTPRPPSASQSPNDKVELSHSTHPTQSIKIEIKPEIKKIVNQDIKISDNVVSLQVLKHGDKNKNKGPSLQNVSALKDAIQKAVKLKSEEGEQTTSGTPVHTKRPEWNDKKESDKKEEHKVEKIEKNPEEDPKTNKKATSTEGSGVPKEVPEDVLRKILKGQ